MRSCANVRCDPFPETTPGCDCGRAGIGVTEISGVPAYNPIVKALEIEKSLPEAVEVKSAQVVKNPFA